MKRILSALRWLRNHPNIELVTVSTLLVVASLLASNGIEKPFIFWGIAIIGCGLYGIFRMRVDET